VYVGELVVLVEAIYIFHFPNIYKVCLVKTRHIDKALKRC